LEEADDIAVLGMRGHPVPESRREGWRAGLDDRVPAWSDLINTFSGKVLGNPGSSRSNGTGIIQWQLNGGLNQQWQIGANGDKGTPDMR
jgi:hypothetical protein